MPLLHLRAQAGRVTAPRGLVLCAKQHVVLMLLEQATLPRASLLREEQYGMYPEVAHVSY